jgi:hypothetical protein
LVVCLQQPSLHESIVHLFLSSHEAPSAQHFWPVAQSGLCVQQPGGTQVSTVQRFPS